MPRHLETTVTFAVKFRLPPGTNAGSAQSYIREAIIQWKQHQGPSGKDSTFKDMETEDFTVRLLKKETLYTTTRKEPA